MPEQIRVILVDDHEVFLDALAVCLADFPDLVVTGTATSLPEALRLVDRGGFDVLVLDLALAGEDGLVVAKEALLHDAEVGIVIATGLDGSEQLVEAVQVGVRGWVPKTVSAAALVDTIRGVSRGETRVPADLLADVLMALSRGGTRSGMEHIQGMEDLTSREMEVLACLVEGMSRTEIGELLHVSPNTVRTHVQSILHKLKVHSALAAVAVARRAGVNGATVRTMSSATT